MEPVGLAVGVLGLVGLFSSCLEAIERFDSWRNFGNELRFLGVRLEAEKLRLEKWGQAVGFERGKPPGDHHEAFNDPRTNSTVKKLLFIIEGICSNADDTFPLVSGSDTGIAKHGFFTRGHSQPHPSTSAASKGQRVKWAMKDKAACMAQVEQLELLVQKLHNLVPLDGAMGTRSGHERADKYALGYTDDVFADRESWTGEFQRILVRMESEIEAETRKDLHAWLLGRHVPNELYDSAIRKRLDGTCDWILSRPSFLDWVSPDFPAESAKLLWINGPAGFGKTILCARVVEYLLSTLDLPIAHFFFSSDFESRRDPFVAIRSWLSQVISRPAAFDLVRERREAQHGQAATRADIVRVFREIVQAIPGCTFVMDGLDECAWMGENWNIDDDSSVDEFLETIKQTVANTTTRILIASRNEPEIRYGIVSNSSTNFFEHTISPEDVRSDTALFSRSIVNRRLPNKDETVKDDISWKLADRCSGQFLWLKMQEPCLRSGKNKKQLEAAIDKTPTGLEHVYDRNWERILGVPDEERARAFSLLRWASFSLRPLTVSEITEALLIDDGCDNLPVDEMPDSIDEDYISSEILGICGSLLEVRRTPSESNIGLRTVHLTHFSVKQYFIYRMSDKGSVLVTNERLRSSNEAIHNSVLAKICLRYVNIGSVWAETLHGDMSQILGSFRDYAAASWHQHAAAGDPKDTEVVRLTNVLLDESNTNWVSWRKWFDLNDEESGKAEAPNETRVTGPLYYASRLDLVETVNYLLHERKHSANEKTDKGRTMLQVSCANGNMQVVKLLLGAGADIVMASDDGWTPLNAAATNGHIEVVQLLLKKGADVAVVDKDGWTPLMLASLNGHIEVVKLLLENGTDVAVVDNDGWTPLISASSNGHTDVVKLLLENGANMAAINKDGWTPLILASFDGHVEVVKLLLEKGADVAAANKDGWTPLNSASSKGHIEVVKLLLENSADMAAANKDGWTPLISASSNGHIKVVKLLLEKGADITIANNYGWTPLYAALFDGHIGVVKLLLENGADVAVLDNIRWTPLILASFDGHVEVVELLLEKGADIAAANKDGWTPLNSASSKGHIEVVKLLLENSADMAAANKDGWTPLISASSNGHAEVVKLLLDNCADVNVYDMYGRTPLTWAVVGGHETVVELLLATDGVDPDSTDRYGQTPLSFATRKGEEKLVGLLLSTQKVDPHSKDRLGRTPVWWARRYGYMDIENRIVCKDENARPIKFEMPGITIRQADCFSRKICDVCWLHILDGDAFHHCGICRNDFYVCEGCFSVGAQCLNDDHGLPAVDTEEPVKQQ